MQIGKHRGKWCIVIWEGGTRVRRSTGLPATEEHRPAAEATLREYRKALASIGNTGQDIMTAYLNDFRGVDKSRQANAWKALQWTYGPLTPDQMTRDVSREYFDDRTEQGRAPATIRRELNVMRAAVNWQNPNTSAVFELPRHPQPRDVWVTKDEFRRLLAAAEDTFHLWVFLNVSICTLGRKEAVLTLPWVFVFWDDNEIDLGFKAGGKNRVRVKMTNACREALLKAHSARRSPYVVEYAGEPVTSIRTSFDRAKKLAGLEHITVHDIRRSGGRWMIEAGTAMEKVSQYLGHSSIEVTRKVYARFQPEWMADATAAVELRAVHGGSHVPPDPERNGNR